MIKDMIWLQYMSIKGKMSFMENRHDREQYFSGIIAVFFLVVFLFVLVLAQVSGF